MVVKLIKQAYLFALLIIPNYIFASDYVWIIGGGDSPGQSQSQIELNVKWALSVINKTNENAQVKIYFTDADDPSPDVVSYIDQDSSNSLFQPYDYIFGGTQPQIQKYHNHSIPNVAGTTKFDSLKLGLEHDFKQIEPDDRVLILYNGHGLYDNDDPSSNYLRLWGETKMTVYDFEKLLSQINPETKVRFIMTQCFSGAFGNAIFSAANNNTLTIQGNRCGFLAQSFNRTSEGCTASIKIGDYRDYTTYFFAALNGSTILNKPLNNNPDLDLDNKINLYEAHLYTLENAYSKDISRSTSEQYLEKWEPWYIRWLGMPKDAKNSIYYKLAYNIAKKNNVAADSLDNTDLLYYEGLVLQNKYKKLHQQDADLENQIKKIQNTIIDSLASSYPNIKKEYGNKFERYDENTLAEIKSSIEQHKDYQVLPGLFDKRSKLIRPLLDAERKLTQIQKIFRMFKLAKLQAYLTTFADNDVTSSYLALLSCEKSNL